MPISQTVEIKNSILRTKQLFRNGCPIKLPSRTQTATNCYAYSLGIMYPKKADERLYIPGFTEGLYYQIGDTEDLMNKIELDLKNLNITFRRFALEDKKSLTKNEYLIKVFYHYSLFFDDFHFIRQDRHTGMWFHKMGWNRQPELVYPTPNDEPSYDMYNPVGYFAIAEGKS